MFGDLTIVTSCYQYSQYLGPWAKSILAQTTKPGAVAILTHGSAADRGAGANVARLLAGSGVPATHEHSNTVLDFGVARNRAVAMARTPWVMHLDTDDTLLPNAVADFLELSPNADVISAGYLRTGLGMVNKRPRVYQDLDGLKALDASAMCSGISPFRKSLWEQTPYRTDMMGAWDTALWIGFARLGARFRATKRAVFNYHQHNDSIFNLRRRVLGWARVRTTAQLKALRRQYTGVSVVVPQDHRLSPDRARNWERVQSHYSTHHPGWRVVPGRCPSVTWVKGAAIMDALGSDKSDILVIADADCLVSPEALQASVELVQNGAPWAMPHKMVHRANEKWTSLFCSNPTPLRLPERGSYDRQPYEGAEGGGIFVIRRVWYDAIGGIPYVFRGWGSEDRALACLANTLLGPCVRGSADLLHLYHKPQTQMPQSQANLQLLRRLGLAAQNGKDALVSTVFTFPNPRGPVTPQVVAQARPNYGTAKPQNPVKTIKSVQERRERLQERRRIP